MKLLDRRTFLRGAGGVALALPFLSSMRAAAQPMPAMPRRLLIVYQTQGMLMDQWRPIAAPGVAASATEVAGSDFSLNTLSAPLEPIKQHLTFLGGIHDRMSSEDETNGNAHQSISRLLLTGAYPTGSGIFDAGAPSVDYEIAQRLYPNVVPKTRTLHLGSTGPWTPFYSGTNAPVDVMMNPQQVFDFLFSDLVIDPTDTQAVLRRARRLQVLDNVADGARRLRRRLPQEDAHLLDGYLSRVRDLAASFSAEPMAGCSEPILDLAPSTTRHVMYDAMFELATMALACDLTRVVTLTMGSYNFPFLPDPIEPGSSLIADDWHEDVVHRAYSQPGSSGTMSVADAQTRFNTSTLWMQDAFARLVQRLASVAEGDGTLLDNTLVLYVNEFGETHGHRDKPTMIAGRAGGLIQPNRWLRYDDVPHNRLLLSLLQGFVEPGDPIHTSFGAADYQMDGPLTGLFV